MRNPWLTATLALAGAATLAGCRVTTDSPLGHHAWSLGHPQSAIACELPPDACPPCRADRCRPADAGLAGAEAVSVDPPASSEMVPLPTRPVFGSRMDGRQAGSIEPPTALPAAEQIDTPPPNAVGAGTSMKLRRLDVPPGADQ